MSGNIKVVVRCRPLNARGILDILIRAVKTYLFFIFEKKN